MDKLGMSWAAIWLTVVTASGVYVTMVVLSRMFGQRQFSRFTTYDLPFVFAFGTLVGRAILIQVSLLGAVVSLITMFALHGASGWLHHNAGFIHRITENRPILLVADGQVIEENLRSAKTTALELCEQLRLSGIGSFGEVQAMVIERTGDVSVVRRGHHTDEDVFADVRGAERLRPS